MGSGSLGLDGTWNDALLRPFLMPWPGGSSSQVSPRPLSQRKREGETPLAWVGGAQGMPESKGVPGCEACPKGQNLLLSEVYGL